MFVPSHPIDHLECVHVCETHKFSIFFTATLSSTKIQLGQVRTDGYIHGNKSASHASCGQRRAVFCNPCLSDSHAVVEESSENNLDRSKREHCTPTSLQLCCMCPRLGYAIVPPSEGCVVEVFGPYYRKHRNIFTANPPKDNGDPFCFPRIFPMTPTVSQRSQQEPRLAPSYIGSKLRL